MTKKQTATRRKKPTKIKLLEEVENNQEDKVRNQSMFQPNPKVMLNYPNYLRNHPPVPQNNPDGEHRYYLPKKYRKKNDLFW